jgi:multidrug transporter EmrE-like cation transporter
MDVRAYPAGRWRITYVDTRPRYADPYQFRQPDDIHHLFKRAGLVIRGQSLFDGLLSLLTQPAFYFVMAIYGFSAFLWVCILSCIPLSQAYPWAAAGVAIVPLLGWCVFGERVGPLFWFGVALILVSILITQYASQTS